MTRAVTRRAVLGGLAAAGGIGIAGGYLMSSADDYDRLLEIQIRPLADEPDTAELVRYATLAASSHNTQAWRFRARAQGIDILPDLTRRTPVVDPDDHHLYASIGCAAENRPLSKCARHPVSSPSSPPATTEPAGQPRVAPISGSRSKRRSMD